VHLEEVQRSPKFSRDFVELGGRDLQLAMGFFQAERSAAWFGGCILLGPPAAAGATERAVIAATSAALGAAG